MSLLILVAIVIGGWWLIGKGHEIDNTPMTYERYMEKTSPIFNTIFIIVAAFIAIGILGGLCHN
jgi:hypothetical protein